MSKVFTKRLVLQLQFCNLVNNILYFDLCLCALIYFVHIVVLHVIGNTVLSIRYSTKRLLTTTTFFLPHFKCHCIAIFRVLHRVSRYFSQPLQELHSMIRFLLAFLLLLPFSGVRWSWMSTTAGSGRTLTKGFSNP